MNSKNPKNKIKIFSILPVIFILMVLLSQMSFAQFSPTNIKIEIKIANSFTLKDIVAFSYTINSDIPMPLTYRARIICPNAPLILPLEKTVYLMPYQTLFENYADFDVTENIGSQTCKAVVEILSPFTSKTEKDFKIITPEKIDLLLNIDKKVFILNENINLGYISNIQDSLVTATLTLPDKTSQQLNLPAIIKANFGGIYKLEAIASKTGYKSTTLNEEFAVIGENAIIKSASVCNANNLCDNNENSQNCPQDCVERPAPAENAYNAKSEATSTTSSASNANTNSDINNVQQVPETDNNIKNTLSGSNFATILVFALIISGLLIGGVEIYRNKTKVDTLHDLAKEHGVHVTHLYLDKLANYIKAAKKKGFSDERIKEKLQEIGWKNWQIDECFSRIQIKIKI